MFFKNLIYRKETEMTESILDYNKRQLIGFNKNPFRNPYFQKNYSDGSKVVVVMGGQFGSEAKGHVVEYLSPLMGMAVRGGAPNAGHTIFYDNKKFIMKMIPCSWINPNCKLVLNRSTVINLDILLEEVELIQNVLPIKHRLFIDPEALVVTEIDIEQESKSDLVKRISSTSARSRKGIGTARANEVLRSSHTLRAKDVFVLRPYILDTVEMVNTALEEGSFILIEGTQGYELSLKNQYFPYTTSINITSAQLLSDCGIMPTQDLDVDILGIFRSYPIRVGGNSGFVDNDSRELSWEELTKIIKADVAVREKTSVTLIDRRIFTFSWQNLQRFCKENRPTEIVLTFADYISWACKDQDFIDKKIEDFIDKMEKLVGIPVTLVSTGEKTFLDFDSYRKSILRKLICVP